MNAKYIKQSFLIIAVAALGAALGAAGGYWWAQRQAMNSMPEEASSPASSAERKVLYWYDPMVPQQRFDQPGKSPFMDMALVPKYADESEASGVKIDPALAQNLGLRLAAVTRAPIGNAIEATGVLGFNEREVAVVQAKSGGFVERVYARAPGDVIAAGGSLADVLVPEWAGAQAEFLALKTSGDAALLEAARARLRLTGMPEALIERVERSGKPQTVATIGAPIGGVIQQLEVRAGMTLAAGQTLARINGLGSVWLEVGVPEAQAGSLRVGQAAQARFAAFPGETVAGRVTAILPEANADSRTLRVRVELPNHDLRLKPGLTAQVRLEGDGKQTALRVPTQAVIRTGKRSVVMLAEAGGRYRPVEVSLGPEVGNDTVILAGLTEGQQVVASGQFLIDSEASLTGLGARLAEPPAATPGAAPALRESPLHESEGRIDQLSASEATLTHGPFKTLGMPGMTMAFPLARPELAKGLKAGDRVRFAVRESDDGMVIERMEKIGGKP